MCPVVLCYLNPAKGTLSTGQFPNLEIVENSPGRTWNNLEPIECAGSKCSQVIVQPVIKNVRCFLDTGSGIKYLQMFPTGSGFLQFPGGFPVSQRWTTGSLSKPA